MGAGSWVTPVALVFLGVVFILGLLRYMRAYARYFAQVAWWKLAAWRFNVHNRREDYPRAHHWLDELARMSRREPALIWIQLNRASLLAAAGHTRDARAMVERVHGTVPTRLTVYRDNLLAWCLAHDGEPERAIGLVETRLGDPGPIQSYLEGTLGAAMVLAGRHDEAVVILEKALAKAGDTRARTIRAFYLGEAHRARGETGAAQAAYARAAALSPKSRYGRLASESLGKLTGAPYRAG